jgi:putative ABC transport system ATP-binding protein
MKIETKNLTKIYRLSSSEITAVNQVSLMIEEMAFIAIVGRSGSGKSTLLNLIGLNDEPTSGKVFIDDRDVSKLSNNQRRKIRLQRMGFVFQTFNLLPTLNARENVELPLALAGKNQGEQKERALKLLETVGLSNRVLHRPKELSMGEMQRVSIARAIANNPEIIIADEPTGELDSNTARETIDLLSRINREEKKTIIVATHDEKVVDQADTSYTMQDGKIETKAYL